MSINDKCPCGSNLKYKKCCKTYHDGRATKNALLLMKSRYSAYALNNYKYIMKTNYTKGQDDTKDSIENFSKNTTFQKLDIIDFIDGEIEAFVTFKATLFSQNKDVSFIEKSKFKKEDERWFYVDGVIT